MRWLLRAAVAVVLLLVVAAAGLWLWLRAGLPDYAGTLRLAGLEGRVEIARDANAVPFIRAETLDDASFALGFAHAQDRLWQMELQRRFAAGRLSELFGDRGLAVDRLVRTLDLYGTAERNLAGLSAEVQRSLAAYAAGVNAFIAGRGWLRPLPPTFLVLRHAPEPWRPADSVAWGRMMALVLGGNWRLEALRAQVLRALGREALDVLWPQDADMLPATKLGSADFRRLAALLPSVLRNLGASNEWVVAGTRTDTGKPILANDPHLRFAAPILWYLARIDTPTLSLAGATVPGVPFFVLGHNGHIAWGFTDSTGDEQDLFIERVDPADPERYLTPDGSAAFSRREERIAVRGAPDDVLQVRATRHGPVISDLNAEDERIVGDGEVVALAMNALRDDDRTTEALYRLNRATDWPSFVAALHDFHSPQQNIVYADRAGNIGFLAPGRLPIRRSGNGRLPAEGWTGAQDWIGLVPFEDLPRALNPAAEFIVNANDVAPHNGGPGLRIPAEPEANDRAQRINEVLRQAAQYSVDSMRALQLDTLSNGSRAILPLLLATVPRSARADAALALLRGWDGHMDRTRPEPLLYAAWLEALGPALFADELGPLADAFAGLRPRIIINILENAPQWCDDRDTPAAEDCPTQLAQSLEHALDWLAATYGDDPAGWRWGDAHRAEFVHPVLSEVPLVGAWAKLSIASDGGNDTVNRGQMLDRGPDAPFRHWHGAGYRGVYDLADLDNSRFVIATGQSGNPLSSHFRDFLDRWRDNDGVRLTADGGRDDTALGLLVLLPAGAAAK